MPYSKTSWVANVTPVTAVSMNNIEAGIASLSAPAPSATPPASPADGDLWYLSADAANGVIWQFRYNAGGGTYKWEFVGGGFLRAEVLTDENLGSTTSVFFDAATQGPQLQMPRNGEYTVSGGATVYASANPGSVYVCLGVDNNAASLNAWVNLAANNAAAVVSQVKLQINGLSYAKMRYLQQAANNHVTNRWISVVPIRVS